MCLFQPTRVYPYRAPGPENPLFLGFSVLRGDLRPWTMVSEGARPWGRGRSGDSDFCPTASFEVNVASSNAKESRKDSLG